MLLKLSPSSLLLRPSAAQEQHMWRWWEAVAAAGELPTARWVGSAPALMSIDWQGRSAWPGCWCVISFPVEPLSVLHKLFMPGIRLIRDQCVRGCL